MRFWHFLYHGSPSTMQTNGTIFGMYSAIFISAIWSMINADKRVILDHLPPQFDLVYGFK